MLKDLTKVLNEIGLKLQWHETLLLTGVLTVCLFTLLCLRYAG